MNKIKFKLIGLTCDACLRLSIMKIGKINGVKEIRVDDLGGKAEIMAERNITLSEIQAALSGTGYKVAKN